MLSKFPAANALVTTFTNLELFKKYKIDKILAFLASYLKFFSVLLLMVVPSFVRAKPIKQTIKENKDIKIKKKIKKILA